MEGSFKELKKIEGKVVGSDKELAKLEQNVGK